MLLMDSIHFCEKTANIWQLVGTILLIFKIVIPLILIILGMVDLGKAVVAQDDKEVGKSAKKFAVRIVSAVIIFFIPTIIGFILTLVRSFTDNTDLQKDYDICRTCLVSPRGKACSGFADTAEGEILPKPGDLKPDEDD